MACKVGRTLKDIYANLLGCNLSFLLSCPVFTGERVRENVVPTAHAIVSVSILRLRSSRMVSSTSETTSGRAKEKTEGAYQSLSYNRQY